MKFHRSIKWRMTTSFLLILSVILLVFGAFSYILIAQAVSGNETTPASIYTILADIPSGASFGTKPPGTKTFERMGNYTISADRIRTIWDGNAAIWPFNAANGVVYLDMRVFLPQNPEEDMKLWVYYRVSPADNTKYEVMAIVTPKSTSNVIMGRYIGILKYAVPVILVMVFVLGFFMVKRLLRPIDAIKQTIQGVNSSNPYKNIELPPGSEFGELTGSLNQAFGRMQETVDRERQIITEASHELRGPMTVLQGEAELALRRSRTAEEYEKTIRILSHESAHLSEMVNKLFLVTKLENAPTLTNPETVNLSDFLTELAPAFKTLCDKRGLPFKMNIEPNIKLTGERFKLRELFYNLVDNAAKFNRPGGEVAVSLKMEGNYARVDVRDTGIGIKPENMEKLFQRFFRIDKDDATGAGLGLVICQKIAELHHGSITVVSKYGKGSTFSVLLPVIE